MNFILMTASTSHSKLPPAGHGPQHPALLKFPTPFLAVLSQAVVNVKLTLAAAVRAPQHALQPDSPDAGVRPVTLIAV